MTILPVLLAVITGAALLTACGSNSSDPGDAVNRVYPEGEGKLYDGSTAADITAPIDSTAQTETTKETKKQTTTAPGETKSTDATESSTTQPATITTDVPADNITGANINPYLGAIQGEVIAEIDAHSVKSISLSHPSITVEVGEKKTVEISFNPSDAVNKICTAETSNGNAKASISGKTVTVSGVNAGTCTLTVTSKNGHKATCNITVKRSAQEITDDTVLPHSELCTAGNVTRWAEAVAAHLESKGMTRDTSLRGGGISLRTDADKSDMSFNAAKKSFAAQAENDAALVTSGSWEDYTFNCTTESLGGGEYSIVITIVSKGE